MVNDIPDAARPGGLPGKTKAAKDELVSEVSDFRVRSLIAAQQSDTERWERPVSVQRLWEMRTRVAAGMIAPSSRVLDLGCGAMALRDHLPPGCTYIAADLVKRSKDTHLIELNKGIWPAVSADCVTALGLLEYIYDVRSFMAGVRVCGPILILTYHIRADPSIAAAEARIKMGWLSDFSQSDIVRAVEQASGEVVRLTAAAPKKFFTQYFMKIQFRP